MSLEDSHGVSTATSTVCHDGMNGDNSMGFLEVPSWDDDGIAVKRHRIEISLSGKRGERKRNRKRMNTTTTPSADGDGDADADADTAEGRRMKKRKTERVKGEEEEMVAHTNGKKKQQKQQKQQQKQPQQPHQQKQQKQQQQPHQQKQQKQQQRQNENNVLSKDTIVKYGMKVEEAEKGGSSTASDSVSKIEIGNKTKAKVTAKAKAQCESTNASNEYSNACMKPVISTDLKRAGSKQKSASAAAVKALAIHASILKNDNTIDSAIPKAPATPVGASPLTALQKKMANKLKGSRFRWINEQLYTTNGSTAYNIFQNDPSLFDIYHEGFRSQVQSWPINPLDVMVDYIKGLPTDAIVADFGCGEAKLAQSVPHKVHSFDLVAANEHITACDMANVPLVDTSIDVAIFSLSLMGSNFLDFVQEARRVLKDRGQLRIAEVSSRLTSEPLFIQAICRVGFKLVKKDYNKMFVDFLFQKAAPNSGDGSGNKNGRSKKKRNSNKISDTSNVEENAVLLKACIYKRR